MLLSTFSAVAFLVFKGITVNCHVKKVFLALSAKESVNVLTMPPVIKRMVHATVCLVGLVSVVTTLALLGTLARTVNQNAGVRMEVHVTQLMATVPVWMNGKEKFVMSVSYFNLSISISISSILGID